MKGFIKDFIYVIKKTDWKETLMAMMFMASMGIGILIINILAVG